MEKWFNIMGLWEVVSIPEPASPAVGAAPAAPIQLTAAQKKKDEKAIFVMRQKLSNARRVTVSACETSAELWRLLVKVCRFALTCKRQFLICLNGHSWRDYIKPYPVLDMSKHCTTGM